jgi:hypothetical protein
VHGFSIVDDPEGSHCENLEREGDGRSVVDLAKSEISNGARKIMGGKYEKKCNFGGGGYRGFGCYGNAGHLR